MNEKGMHQINVDEEVYAFLKQHAEPFKDTPNSVIRRFLPLKSGAVEIKDNNGGKVLPQFPQSVPNALAEILEVIILVKNQGLSRVEATHKVAELRGITTQAVIDKYCRQLGKRAYEVDDLLTTSNMDEFKTLLIERFPYHSKVIESVFEKIKK
jgi:negative regulator of replication initiation